jgi:dCTP diphosphatase|tara:strand:- start:91 stop:444 length:354 start_codon:yes stop_codon:yes gene_type:complete
MEQTEVKALMLALRKFAKDRDWEQFHSPKNLSMALSVEVSELLEHFQWMPDQASYALGDAKQQLVAYEIADVFIYLLRLCDQLDIDLISVTKEKMKINDERYPVSKVKGSSKKYSEY